MRPHGTAGEQKRKRGDKGTGSHGYSMRARNSQADSKVVTMAMMIKG
jgi:hypothetical protein